MASTNTTHISIWRKVQEHIELIAALISGLFIMLGWILSKNDLETISIITYLLAFGIGGFAKAKEGITDTIETKKLNVEI